MNMFHEVSCKTGEGVESAFNALVQHLDELRVEEVPCYGPNPNPSVPAPKHQQCAC